MLAELAAEISKSGITVVTPSYRTLDGHGATVFDAIEDAHNVCIWFAQWARGRPTILIGGASAGGLLAVHAFSRMPNSFSGMILMNPVTNTSENGFSNRQISVGVHSSVSPHSMARALPKAPTLILHSVSDQVVPISQTDEFIRKWNNPKLRLVRWPKGPHGFFNTSEFRAEAALEVTKFIFSEKRRDPNYVLARLLLRLRCWFAS